MSNFLLKILFFYQLISFTFWSLLFDGTNNICPVTDFLLMVIFRSLAKTQLILTAMERKRKRVTCYALDMNRNESERSLSSLGSQFNYVQLVGLLGTYEQAIPWLKHQSKNIDTGTMILWLGSSVGTWIGNIFASIRSKLFATRRFTCGWLQSTQRSLYDS